jgi:hypothetical protein
VPESWASMCRAGNGLAALAERTPAYRIPSHGTDALGQRFAYDLVRTDHRRGFHLHAAGTLRG